MIFCFSFLFFPVPFFSCFVYIPPRFVQIWRFSVDNLFKIFEKTKDENLSPSYRG